MLYRIAFPMMITGLLMYGKSLISMVFLGKLGKDALAGGSLGIGIANISGYSVIYGLALGMEAISSQAFGAKHWPLLSQTLQRTLCILLFACIPISLLWLNIHPLLLLCDQDPTISSVASTYLTFCLPDLLFQSLINPLKIYLRAQNITLPLISSAAFALALHAPINYFLVIRLSLGVPGVALALSIADFALLSTLIAYMHRKSSLAAWAAPALHCFDDDWRSILKLALPSCFSVCLEWWCYELMILISGILSNAADAVAAMGILIQATSFVYIFPSALSLAASTRVGNELGANQPGRARAASQVAIVCAVATSVMATSFMVTLADMWGRAFTDDEAVVALTAALMPVVGLCELGNCPQTTGCGVLRGSARPTLGAHINVGSFYGVGLPLAFLMAFVMKLGLLGLWLGLLGAQIVCALLMLWILSRTNWVVQANRARQLLGIQFHHGLTSITTFS
ncbi:MATE efflux family protein [Perilla frutescens var. hirtella]|uniref:Protein DETOXIFICATION n=1 Tax=Perilla frutescens var. hirtella TaxID=608512 RepID=A0AAD4JR13_PERFH|nr:MATE efflux family protein [Perilla frutescens var. frutescens]KAH6784293.1 MATE efflux family protein [Perilla frutescens var. hirtella]KAH6838086.1 MATE efflux family protein [Perilla frutescens var. hirtella]